MDRGYRVTIIRSARKTVALQVCPDGSVVLRAPRWVKQADLDRFLERKRGWLEAQLRKMEEHREASTAEPPLTREELNAIANQAMLHIPERVRYYAPLVGVSYGRITIRCQKTRWGSCSSKGNLNFNCLLMLTPPEVLDSVVVHELCHRREMNHSERFYAEVYRVFPEYDRYNGWLKEHGGAIMARLPR